MEVATFAMILGIYECLVGIPMVVNPRATFRWLIHGMDNNDVLTRAIGAAFLIMASLVLAGGMAITRDVTGFIRFLAWATAIKCLLLCWSPHLLIHFRRRLIPNSPTVQRFIGLVAVALGVFLLWASCSLRCGACCGACGS